MVTALSLWPRAVFTEENDSVNFLTSRLDMENSMMKKLMSSIDMSARVVSHSLGASDSSISSS